MPTERSRPPRRIENGDRPHPSPGEMALRVGSAMLIAASVALLAQWYVGPGDPARSSHGVTRTSAPSQ